MLQKDDPAKQLVYYQVASPYMRKSAVLTEFRQAGIGTYTSDVLKTPIIERTSKFVDVMIAWNMPEHIKGLSESRAPLPTIPNQSFQMATGF